VRHDKSLRPAGRFAATVNRSPRSASRRRLTVAVLLVAVLVAAAGLAFAGVTSGTSGHAASGPTAQASAACADMGVVESEVSADASARRVLGELTAAQRLAAAAARTDPAWQALADGIDAVLVGLRTNAAAAAYEGIQVVLENCRQAGG
jgi:hypothetical protein